MAPTPGKSLRRGPGLLVRIVAGHGRLCFFNGHAKVAPVLASGTVRCTG